MALFGLTDTDAIVDTLRARGGRTTFSDLVRQQALAISAVSVFELEFGVAPEDDLQRQRLDGLVASLTILNLDARAARTAAEVRRLLESVGLRIDPMEALIAGVALANDLPLITRNLRHFERVPGLRIITY